jgi:hypothetical protein
MIPENVHPFLFSITVYHWLPYFNIDDRPKPKASEMPVIVCVDREL